MEEMPVYLFPSKYKMTKYIFHLSILSILVFPIIGIGSNGTISGKIDFCKGQQISLLIYDNFITNTKKEITEAIIDSLGNFSLQFKLNSTQYVVIKSNYIEKLFPVEPGKKYNITITSEEKLNAEQINSPFVSEFFSLSVINDTLNQKLGELEEMLGNFIVSNSLELTARGGQKKIEELEKNLVIQFNNYTNTFFQDILKYRIALLKMMANFYTNDKFVEIYFSNKPVLFENLHYMSVFNECFTKYLKNFNYKNEYNLSLKELINTNADYDEISHLLYQDANLHSDTLRELVLLKGLFELYYDKDYNQANILKLVHYMEGCALYKVNRDVAESMGNLFLSSAQAIDFTLHDISGKQISLSSFKNKYVYLNFWKSEIPECSNDFDIMSEYYEKCKEKVEFISICTDSKVEKMKTYLEQHPQYQWPFLYYENNFNLLESFHVVSFPSYILIDPKGYIIDYSAARPSENLASLLTHIMTSK